MIDATGGYISSSSLHLTQIQYRMRYDNRDGQRGNHGRLPAGKNTRRVISYPPLWSEEGFQSEQAIPINLIIVRTAR